MDPKHERRSARDHYVFVARGPGRWLLRLVLLLAVVIMSVAATRFIIERETWIGVVAGLAFGLSVLTYALMEAKSPQRITVSGAIIEIRRDGHTHTFDLEDPNVDVRVKDGEIAFAHYMERYIAVRSRDVDWKVFSDLVMGYQTKADRHAEERDRRFSK